MIEIGTSDICWVYLNNHLSDTKVSNIALCYHPRGSKGKGSLKPGKTQC